MRLRRHDDHVLDDGGALAYASHAIQSIHQSKATSQGSRPSFAIIGYRRGDPGRNEWNIFASARLRSSQQTLAAPIEGMPSCPSSAHHNASCKSEQVHHASYRLLSSRSLVDEYAQEVEKLCDAPTTMVEPAESSTNPANPFSDTHRERKPAGVEIYAPSLASEIGQVA